MRADRLVATLLLLQRRRQVTAAEVARELEVSERTARRDLDALAAAGVPVYSVQGRGGGWRLVGGARTDLSGLTAREARTLFLVAGPASQATPAARTALRKLVRALPEPFRDEAESAASSLVTDPLAWNVAPHRAAPPPFLDDLQDAVIRGVQVRLGYVDGRGAASQRTVHPLGVVSKGSAWYLVCGTEAGGRTFRVDRVTSVDVTEDAVERPADFDLAATWRAVADGVHRMSTPAHVRALATSEGLAELRITAAGRLDVGGAAPDGRVEVVVRGYSAHTLAVELAGLVAWVEVTGPPEALEHLSAIAAALTARYDPSAAGSAHRSASGSSTPPWLGL